MYLVSLWTLFAGDSNRVIAPDVLRTAWIF